LPEETRRAIETQGRSEIDALLEMPDPPLVIQCGTFGCRPV